jgi:hypothetical protein
MTTYEFAIQLTQPKQKGNQSKKGKTSNSSEEIYNKIKIVEGSVLGKHPKDNSVLSTINETTALVDAAGRDYMINTTVKGADGSAKPLYEYIGLQNTMNSKNEIYKSTPDPVKKYFMQHDTGAFLQEYNLPSIGNRSVIHAVGPKLIDLLEAAPKPTQTTQDDERITRLVNGLTPIYKKIFELFCNSNLTDLRLIPISTGIFANGFFDDLEFAKEKAILMQQFTCISILHALHKLKHKNKYKLNGHIFLCIWTGNIHNYRNSHTEAIQWYKQNMNMLRGGAPNFHSIKNKKRRKYSNINKAKLVKRTLHKRNTFSKYT